MNLSFLRQVRSSKRFRFILRFGVACVAAFALEKVLEHKIESHTESGFLAQTIFSVDVLYHRIVTAGPREPQPRFTTLVEINPLREPGIATRDNVCEQRKFMNVLLRRIASAQPQVVVVDKYFAAGVCEQFPDATAALLSGIGEVCRQGAAVVTGTLATQENEHEYPRLAATLPIGSSEPCDLRAGLTNLDPDTRRIPLIWRVVDEAHEGTPKAVPSLSLAAAEAAHPEITSRPSRLTRLLESTRNPYTTVFSQDSWGPYKLPAGQIVCGKPISARDDWRACGDYQLPDEVRRRLRGRVVVIGEYSPREDSHATFLGEMPGYVLQAGFIESLLDDRLFKPVPDVMNYVAGFLFFALFEYICEASVGWIVILRRLAVLGLLASSLVYVVVIHLGYFLNPAALSIAYLIIKLSGLIVTRFGVAAGHSQEFVPVKHT